MKVVQINVVGSQGSTGRIVQDLKQKISQNGWECLVAYGRNKSLSAGEIQIGNRSDHAAHLLRTRIFDNHGFASRHATDRFLDELQRVQPDIIHLHNLHGYYINVESLFDFLRRYGKPVVWTLHDCWPFTGHCTYFTHIGCQKWIDGCYRCPLKNQYPASYFLDRSRENYLEKKKLFTGLPNLSIVTVSNWLRGLVRSSFLGSLPVTTIYNGVDLSTFSPAAAVPHGLTSLPKEGYVLAVANVWTARKGLADMLELRKRVEKKIPIVIVGLDAKQLKGLPEGVFGCGRTANIDQLARLYANALAFVNPSRLETFGMVTAEALACGTPVIVYNATASPELVAADTGFIVETGDVDGIARAVQEIQRSGRSNFVLPCRQRAEHLFDKEKQYQKYLDLYYSLR